MFMMITFPWPVASANAALTASAANSNRVRVADQEADDVEPVGVRHGTSSAAGGFDRVPA
jgi:hypothetical protein